MSQLPLISVLLPCYNAELFIEEAVKSILNQTYKQLEVICIDDGSSDSTLRVLNDFASRDKRIKVVKNEKNLGLIDSLNIGVSHANGEYIARMDADDISIPSRIEVLIDKLLTSNVDIISSGYEIISEEGNHIGFHKPKCYSNLACVYSSFFITPIAHACILVKREVLKDNLYVKNESTLHSEDYELWCRLLKKEYRFENIIDPLYKVRVNPKSVSRKFETIQVNNFISLVLNNFVQNGFDNIDRQTASVLCLRINKQVQIKHLKKAFEAKKKLTRNYLQQANKAEKKEIQFVNKYIFLSILLQAIKRGNNYVRLIGAILLVLVPFILNKTVLNYYKNR